VAVVNQAILDVLEHGEDAKDAERWLLGKDFDALQSREKKVALANKLLRELSEQ